MNWMAGWSRRNRVRTVAALCAFFLGTLMTGIGPLLDSASGTPLALGPLPQGNTLHAVAYGNGEFVAVGDGGAILTSPDGTVWTEQGTSGTSCLAGTCATFYGVTYGGGEFVAVGALGNAGVILTSPDGVTWTRQSYSTGILSAVTFGNGEFVAVKQNGIITSPDGVTWTSRNSGGAGSLDGVTYGNGHFVAVGPGFDVATSSNGTTWTAYTYAGNVDYRGVVAGTVGGTPYYVGVGYNSSLAMVTADDTPGLGSNVCGIPSQGSNTAGNYSMNAVAYDPASGYFVAVGDKGRIIAAATNLCSDWGVTSGADTAYNLEGIAYGGGTFVAVGTEGTILSTTSADGSLWNSMTVTLDLKPGAHVPPPLQFLDVTSPSQGDGSVPQVLTSLTGTVGEPFFDVLHSDGGVSYSTWSLTGGSLPPGVALKASGAIIGVPTQAGTYTFTVQMADLAMHTATQQLTITVGNPQ